ncbi:Aste57867_1487 [Aphanomyces stellatus]|uniref:Aste57867_1487 protein n=1 Tax=Aphanomyces stellatus TaxID=120398 RepID=A0A485K577_9STRA|nr:hypothetical protein As57867_001486 [Aphanomyces stellatus]VFT78703.1 Aste57867_1487 [Aphanomyces stellatus]
MYRDSSLEVTEDPINQIAHGDGGFHVERLNKVRHDCEYQVHVKWMGLDDEKMSWELAKKLLDDILVVFIKWCKSHKPVKNMTDRMMNPGLL